MRCSACEKEATLSWQRNASDDETAAHLDGLRNALFAVNEHRRLGLRLHIAQLQQQTDNLPPEVLAGDVEQIRASVAAEVARAQEEHDSITEQVDLTHHMPVTVAVYGCDDHHPAIPDEVQP